MIGKAEVIQPLVARDCVGKLPEVIFPIADYPGVIAHGSNAIRGAARFLRL
jgi:hypothetical protein